MDIRDDAIGGGKIRRRQKLFCRGKRLSSMTNGVHKIHQAETKLFVIVDDRNERVIHQMQPRYLRTMIPTR
jgi:hypothetical protein